MKRLILVLTAVLAILLTFSCTQLFEPRTSKVSVVLSSGQEDSKEGFETLVDQSIKTLDSQSELLKRSEAPWVKDIEKLEVKVSKFSYKYSTGPTESNWATPTTIDKTVDLISLSSSEIDWLTFDIPKGAVILAISFEISQATVTVNGTSHKVDIPSGSAKIVLKNLNWEIREDGQIILNIDWSRSIIKVSGSNYKLVPRIAYRWRSTLKNLWAIEGTIKREDGSAPTEPLLIGLYEGEDTSATPLTLRVLPVTKAGEFYLGKYKPGTYTIVVWNELTFEYDGDEIVFSGKQVINKTFEHGKTSATTMLDLTY